MLQHIYHNRAGAIRVVLLYLEIIAQPANVILDSKKLICESLPNISSRFFFLIQLNMIFNQKQTTLLFDDALLGPPFIIQELLLSERLDQCFPTRVPRKSSKGFARFLKACYMQEFFNYVKSLSFNSTKFLRFVDNPDVESATLFNSLQKLSRG